VQLLCETLELHQIVESLLGCAPQVLSEQRAVHVLLVSFDHRIRLEPEPPENRRALDRV